MTPGLHALPVDPGGGPPTSSSFLTRILAPLSRPFPYGFLMIITGCEPPVAKSALPWLNSAYR